MKILILLILFSACTFVQTDSLVIGTKEKDLELKGLNPMVRGYSQKYFFQSKETMIRWLKVKGYLSAEWVPLPITETAFYLMENHLREVRKIRAGNFDPFYEQFSRYTNSEGNYFYRTGSKKYRPYTGYVSDGTGINYCTKKVDTTWGLDCSGFIQLVYLMHGMCFPRAKSKNFWTLMEGKDDNTYLFSKEVMAEFFEITKTPEPGDLVVQRGHIGIYINENLSIAMDGAGISVELYKQRPKKENPHTFFVRLKTGKKVKRVCSVGERCDVCNDYAVKKYMKKEYTQKSRRYIKHLHPLFFTEENGAIYLKDQLGKGSGKKYCEIEGIK